jgi:hypothetical protein
MIVFNVGLGLYRPPCLPQAVTGIRFLISTTEYRIVCISVVPFSL